MSIVASRLVWGHSKATGSALVIMLALADHAGETLTAWPSVPTLARLAKLTERQVRTLLRALVETGDISAVGTGPRGVTVYRITCGIPEANFIPEADFTPETGFTPEAYIIPEASFIPTPEVGFRGKDATPEASFTPTPEVGFRGKDATPEASFRPPLKPASPKPPLNHHITNTVDFRPCECTEEEQPPKSDTPALDGKNAHLAPASVTTSGGQETERAFAAFWDRYPSRGVHGNPRKPAAERFAAAIKRGVDPDAIIRGAENYAIAVSQERTEPRFVAQAVTWLNQERWNDHQRRPESTRRDDGWC